MLLELPDVTLVALYGVSHELTQMAIDECCRQAKFGDVVLFTDQTALATTTHQPATVISAGPFADYVAAGLFTTHEVPRYVATSHALFIHWDSWVVDPGAWTDEFLNYDYVGAPWWYRDGYNVGNSGFCLRSKRLMDFLADHADEFPFRMPEDDTLCRRYRRRLEALGFRWAPEGLAHRFAFERVRAALQSFGFHGVFNFHQVLDREALAQRAEMVRADPHARSRTEYQELEQILRRVGLGLSEEIVS